MPGTVTVGSTSFPFDEEIFALHFENQPNLVRDAMVSSGAMVNDAYIASLVQNGSNTYTMPFYNALADGDEDNYDGQTDMTTDQITGASQSGVVFGRMKAWEAPQFISDFTSAKPMSAIAARIAPWYVHQTQKRIIGITNAVLGVTKMKSHAVTKTALNENTLSDVTQEIWGDNKDNIVMAIMHSAVAQEFEDLNRANYLKYTDQNGMTRQVRTIDVNGILCIIDDGTPYTAASGDGSTPATYDTYLFGRGALRYAPAPVTKPVETWRDPKTKGGVDFIGTRKRETIHPNGFSFVKPSAMTESPTNAQLFAKANWELAYSDPRAILIGKMTTPGHAA
ncbi:coat protein [Adlercreutzia sp. ZJ242]|uniref:coat protein n=1 Tax=Adlercreutzia sp. ZJ242 TaxID=2709409 RepID=UPI0013EB6380|nr:coat protein [Adlercreutzia sp. ZJ242]